MMTSASAPVSGREERFARVAADERRDVVVIIIIERGMQECNAAAARSRQAAIGRRTMRRGREADGAVRTGQGQRGGQAFRAETGQGNERK